MKKVILLVLLSNVSIHAQWKVVPTGITTSLYAVQFFDTSVGIVAGANGVILRTTDGGNNWFLNPNYVNVYPDLYSLSLYGGSSGWISGRFGVLLQTTDKGQTWVQRNGFASAFGGYYLSHATFLSDTVGWLCGVTNALLRTKFGDGFWTKEFVSREPLLLNYMHTKDATSGYLVGNSGVAVKTIDHGYSWTFMNTGVTAKLENVTFVNDLSGWIVGASGTILKTTDGGNSWPKYDISPQYHFTWISFINDTAGWIVGSPGIILKTSNAGGTWNIVPSGTSVALRAAFFVDEHHGWIVGDSGKVLLYDPAIATSVRRHQNEIQEMQFEVSQNYPNPFNPTTTIRFSIPQGEYVDLKLFDTSGRLVRTLVKRYYDAGTHEVIFSASDLASGMYVFHLKAGDNTAARKIVLTK